MAGGFVRIVFRRPEGAGVVNGELNGDDRVNDSRNGYVNGEVNTLTPSQKLVYDTVNNNPGNKPNR